MPRSIRKGPFIDTHLAKKVDDAVRANAIVTVPVSVSPSTVPVNEVLDPPPRPRSLDGATHRFPRPPRRRDPLQLVRRERRRVEQAGDGNPIPPRVD